LSIPIPASNQPQEHRYFYDDMLPMQGRNIYRLKMTDIDFNTNGGHEVEVYFAGDDIVKLYPNPTSDHVFVDNFSDKSKEITLQWMDVTGKKVATQLIKAQAGNNSLQIDLSELAKGMYVLQVMQGSRLISTNKVNKQ
jgi:hypothetical protein